jgi:hypothetical protein
MAKKIRVHVNPYKLLSFAELTHEYARILNNPNATEERLSASRDLCDVLINLHLGKSGQDSCFDDTVRSMIGKLQSHVGDQ